MVQLTVNIFIEHLIRFAIIALGILVAILLGHCRPEWKSRKTVISWVWTIAAIDVMIMGGDFARSLSAQMFIAGALMLNIINFVGDRIENIKFKDFSASLTTEGEYDKKHSIIKGKKKNKLEEWPDGPGKVK